MGDLHRLLEDHLLNSIMPFWDRHAIDPGGGINTCIGDDGAVISQDKWLWSQWRAVWVYSTLYRCIEQKQEWLETASKIHDFVAQHGWDEQVGGWVLTLSADGEVLRGCESIYADGFAIYALVAFAHASRREAPLALACQTADNVLRRLQLPDIPHFPYPIPPGARMHGIPMMFSLVMWELGELADEPRYREAAIAFSDDIFTNFYRADRDLIVERIAADNSECPPPLGTTVVPGHVIEDMWFQIHIARDRGDIARIGQACQLIRSHIEVGWDGEYGGLFLALDADGRDDVAWEFADTKLWWPHTEAMYALLLAYEHCRQAWCLDWYERVHRYSFAHYPVAEHGEWQQKLDRRGRPLTDVVALPVKDPFHLPRALIYCLELLKRV